MTPDFTGMAFMLLPYQKDGSILLLDGAHLGVYSRKEPGEATSALFALHDSERDTGPAPRATQPDSLEKL